MLKSKIFLLLLPFLSVHSRPRPHLLGLGNSLASGRGRWRMMKTCVSERRYCTFTVDDQMMVGKCVEAGEVCWNIGYRWVEEEEEKKVEGEKSVEKAYGDIIEFPETTIQDIDNPDVEEQESFSIDVDLDTLIEQVKMEMELTSATVEFPGDSIPTFSDLPGLIENIEKDPINEEDEIIENAITKDPEKREEMNDYENMRTTDTVENIVDVVENDIEVEGENIDRTIIFKETVDSEIKPDMDTAEIEDARNITNLREVAEPQLLIEADESTRQIVVVNTSTELVEPEEETTELPVAGSETKIDVLKTATEAKSNYVETTALQEEDKTTTEQTAAVTMPVSGEEITKQTETEEVLVDATTARNMQETELVNSVEIKTKPVEKVTESEGINTATVMEVRLLENEVTEEYQETTIKTTTIEEDIDTAEIEDARNITNLRAVDEPQLLIEEDENNRQIVVVNTSTELAEPEEETTELPVSGSETKIDVLKTTTEATNVDDQIVTMTATDEAKSNYVGTTTLQGEDKTTTTTKQSAAVIMPVSGEEITKQTETEEILVDATTARNVQETELENSVEIKTKTAEKVTESEEVDTATVMEVRLPENEVTEEYQEKTIKTTTIEEEMDTAEIEDAHNIKNLSAVAEPQLLIEEDENTRQKVVINTSTELVEDEAVTTELPVAGSETKIDVLKTATEATNVDLQIVTMTATDEAKLNYVETTTIQEEDKTTTTTTKQTAAVTMPVSGEEITKQTETEEVLVDATTARNMQETENSVEIKTKTVEKVTESAEIEDARNITNLSAVAEPQLLIEEDENTRQIVVVNTSTELVEPEEETKELTSAGSEIKIDVIKTATEATNVDDQIVTMTTPPVFLFQLLKQKFSNP